MNLFKTVTTDLTRAVTREVAMLAELEEGTSVDGAERPLTDEERASGVRFGELEEAQEEYLAAVLPILVGLGQKMGDSVGDYLSSVMRTPPGGWVLEDHLAEVVTSDAERRISYHMLALSDTMRSITYEEVERGGGRALHVAPDDPPYGVMAATVVGVLWDRVSTVATRSLTPAALIGEATPAPDFTGVHKAALDQARQIGHAITHDARVRVFEAVPRVGTFYASELMDTATCDRCARVDGREYATLADALEDYPRGGGYGGCEGGARCRGTIVAVWKEEK